MGQKYPPPNMLVGKSVRRVGGADGMGVTIPSKLSKSQYPLGPSMVTPPPSRVENLWAHYPTINLGKPEIFDILAEGYLARLVGREVGEGIDLPEISGNA